MKVTFICCVRIFTTLYEAHALMREEMGGLFDYRHFTWIYIYSVQLEVTYAQERYALPHEEGRRIVQESPPCKCITNCGIRESEVKNMGKVNGTLL